jgi:hypothetical protein
MNIDAFHNLNDFDWGQHTYSILSKYLPEISDNLNDRSEFAFMMTKGNFGNAQIDTTPFREGIVMYLMSIFGMKDDAYAYKKMNAVL